VKRSSLLRLGAAPFAAALLPRRAFAASARSVRDLAPVAVALDSVTRTTVGLRPYRRGGFVVRAEAAGAKTVVHHYGHGGGGMSLSWGTALQARAMALATEKRSAAVIGCGVIGLSTARVLQDAGFTVRIYARDVPPETTSNVSGAQWTPSSLYVADAVDAAYMARFAEASELAQRRFQTLLGDDYGVRWIENYDCYDTPGRGFFNLTVPAVNRHLYPEFVEYAPGQHPFPTRYASKFLTMIIEPNRYLRALVRDFFARGGTLQAGALASGDVARLPEPLVFNCAGLGARELFGDAELEPVRGQLSILAPQPRADYIVLSPAGYVFPRSDGVVLGGTFEHGNAGTVPDPATERRILAGHQRFFAAMRS
jgi:glycine/D-amino acid oxidase-like deaminating enzyme